MTLKGIYYNWKFRYVRWNAQRRANEERKRIVVLKASDGRCITHSMQTWKRLIKEGAFKPYKVTAEMIREQAYFVADPRSHHI